MIWVAILLPAYSQQNLLNRLVSINIEDQSVVEALRQLMKEVPCTINFIPSEVPKGRSINKSYREEPLGKVIEDIWGNEQLSLRVRGNTISIQANSIKPQALKNVKLQGRITDVKKEYLPGVAVRLDGTLLGAVTDGEGKYEILNIPIGKYAVSVSSVGFETQEKIVTLTKDQKLNFILEQAINQLEEVVVVGETAKSELEKTAQAITVIETREAKLKTADLGEVLARTEGVNIRRSGGLGSSTQFALNGFQGEQVRLFLNGIPLDFIGVPTEGIGNIPVNLVERVEIYKGVVPIQFGADALGGAVNLVSPQDFTKNGGAISYQIGSFGTHRATLDFQIKPKNSKVFFRGKGFYDYAKNNYKIDVSVPNEVGRPQDVTVERFHDTYEAKGINTQIGLQNQSWADQFSLELYAQQFLQDIQNNATMSVPYGEAKSSNTAYSGLLRWNKKFDLNFSLKLVGGYTYNETNFTDTTTCIYNWLGECVRRDPIPGEIGFSPQHIKFWDQNYYARTLLGYQLSDRSEIKLSLAPTNISRTGENFLSQPNITDALSDTRNIFTLINGASHEWKSKDEKLQNTVFFKSYFQSVKAKDFLPGGIVRDLSRQKNIWGVGNGMSYTINKSWLLKLSFERAARIPRATEIFGNGALILPNLELVPEQSTNVNLQVNYKKTTNSIGLLKVGMNGFYRNSDNLILLLANREGVFQYQNVFSAVSQGIELVSSWRSANNRLSVDMNSTWQDFRNTSNEGILAIFEGDRIPNRPYFFVNSSASYRFNVTVLSRRDVIRFFANSRYVKGFFRIWESAGLRQFKQTIPDQHIQNLGVTFLTSLNDSPLSLTFESQNLLNAKNFDFFGVQRPGRSFNAKATFNF